MSECWERQPGESLRAYEAARVYFELGPSRSLAAVAQKCKKSVSLVARWSSRWSWRERAAGYDQHMAMVEMNARRQALAQEAEEWARRQTELRDQEWEASRALLERAREMLAFPLTTVVENDGATIVQPARWSFKDVAAFLDLASKLGRRAADMDEPGAQVHRALEKELATTLDRLEQRLPRDIFLRVLEAIADEPEGHPA